MEDVNRFRFLPTAYVVRREGYVLTRVCPSVCPHLGGGVPRPGLMGGGCTPAGGVLHLRYPLSDLARGVPCLGYPPVRPGWGVPLLGIPPQTWLGRYPCQGGYPCWGVPHLGYPPVRPGQGSTPARCTPPQVPPIGPGRGGTPTRGVTPAGGYCPHQTWPGGYPCQGGTRDGVLDTPRSVCLLRSRRRTFLYQMFCSGTLNRGDLFFDRQLLHLKLVFSYVSGQSHKLYML